MTTDQLSLIEGDAASQYRFVLCALIEDALRILRDCDVAAGAGGRHVYDQALNVLRDAATELRLLPGEEPVPF